MRHAGLETQVLQLLQVVDPANGRDRKASQMRMHQQRLSLKVGNASDAQITPELGEVSVKFRPEGRVFNVVNRPLEAMFLPVYGHARTTCAKV